MAAFAGCANNATATNLQSRSRIITVSVLDGGPSLFADKPLAKAN